VTTDSGSLSGYGTLEHGFWFRVVLGVILRPWLWPTALRLLVRMAPASWWRRAPFVPRPDPAYIRFRLETAYGTTGVARAADVLTYLEWCRTAAR
jgi:hypothetical protein